MTLQEQFEKEHYERPCEPYSKSENPEQWCQVLEWSEDYIKWLESKFTSDNSDYARGATPKSCTGCRYEPEIFCTVKCSRHEYDDMYKSA